MYEKSSIFCKKKIRQQHLEVVCRATNKEKLRKKIGNLNVENKDEKKCGRRWEGRIKIQEMICGS